MKYMLDTNICIYAINNNPEKILLKLKQIDPEDVCISSVTYSELVYGVEKSATIDKNRVALSLLLSNIAIMDFDVMAAEEYGRIRAELEKKGTPIGPLDMMIAAHAKSLGLIIVTKNIKEFSELTRF